MFKKWVAIMVFGSTWLSGCVSAGLFGWGENVSYTFWNNSDEVIEKVETVGLYQEGRIKYLSAQSETTPHKPMAGRPTHWFMGGDRYMSDTGHKVPEEVEVRWRKLPPPGGKEYTGQRMGPYRVLVRSRIPQEALRLARRNAYSLGITFSVGKEPVLLCWGVVAEESTRGRSAIMSGGQCNPEDVAWRDDIDWRKPGVWFPEPISADKEAK